MNNGSAPNLVIIAGPNRAGKSTVASFLLGKRSISRFINADTIAQGMSITNIDQISAGKIMLSELHSSIKEKQSIAFETTLAGRTWKRMISTAKKMGYETTICFIGLRSPELACQRVQNRVSLGGHAIPENTIRRRFKRSIYSFISTYKNYCDNWYLFDNSGDSAILVAAREAPESEKIFYREIYEYYKAIS